METRTCSDCGVTIRVRPEDLVEDAIYVCAGDYQNRFKNGKFDSMPANLNFSRTALSLTIHGRPVRWGARTYEQAQDGLVNYGGRT